MTDIGAIVVFAIGDRKLAISIQNALRRRNLVSSYKRKRLTVYRPSTMTADQVCALVDRLQGQYRLKRRQAPPARENRRAR